MLELRKIAASCTLFLSQVLTTPAIAAPCFPAPTFLRTLTALAPNGPFLTRGLVLAAYESGRRWALDPRLPLAISGQETRFGTDPAAQICLSRYNAWGVMACTRNGCSCRQFRSWEHGIEQVSALLRSCYLNADCNSTRGGPLRNTIPLIGEVYCGQNDPGCAVWARAVRFFYRRFGGTSTPDGSGDRLEWAGGCCVDCSGDGVPFVNDLLIGINVLLGNFPLQACWTLDLADTDPATNGFPDGSITVDEVLIGVNEALLGCPTANY